MCDPTEMHQTSNGGAANKKELMIRCPDATEEIDSGILPSKYELLPLVTRCDSDLDHDRVTRRSICGGVVILGKIAKTHKPQRQTGIQTSTCGAELNDRRVGIECCQEIRHICRSLGVEVNIPTKHYVDN